MAIVINMFMFATAVPFIRSSLDLPADSTSWLVAAYTVPNVVFMPFYGIWGDSVGKRRLLFSGLACFGVGSLICLASRSFDSIIIGRIIQGFGAASVTPLGISIIYEFTAEDKVGTMLGTWHMMGPVASTTGPILGGLIIDSFGWRSVFLPVSIVTAITLICLLLLIPKDNRRSQVSTIVRTFDWPGLFFVAGGVSFFGFFYFKTSDYRSPAVSRLAIIDCGGRIFSGSLLQGAPPGQAVFFISASGSREFQDGYIMRRCENGRARGRQLSHSALCLRGTASACVVSGIDYHVPRRRVSLYHALERNLG